MCVVCARPPTFAAAAMNCATSGRGPGPRAHGDGIDGRRTSYRPPDDGAEKYDSDSSSDEDVRTARCAAGRRARRSRCRRPSTRRCTSSSPASLPSSRPPYQPSQMRTRCRAILSRSRSARLAVLRASLGGSQWSMRVARTFLCAVDGATCWAGSWVPPSVRRAQRRRHSNSHVLFERGGRTSPGPMRSGRRGRAFECTYRTYRVHKFLGQPTLNPAPRRAL
ncbi:hypothetical protein EDB85DRAFT_114001 [Lactarius pseudohatsudake]|nr:hypothetical protein EDB85DRAFT_114001 [Lactarius pseudohatsudake]